MKRPIYVTISGILLTIAGIGQIAFGALVLAIRNDAEELAKADVTSNQALGAGIGLLVAGVVSILLAVGLMRGSRVVRGIFGVFALAQIGFGIYAMATLSSDHRSGAIGGIGGAAVSLYLLFGTDKSKEFFAAKGAHSNS